MPGNLCTGSTTITGWHFNIWGFSSVQLLSRVRLCNPMNRSTPGLLVHHRLPESAQTHVHWVSDAIQPSHPVIPFSSCPQSFPASGSFPMSQLFTWGGQSTGVSASTSVLPVNTQDCSPLGWTGWPSLQSVLYTYESKGVNLMSCVFHQLGRKKKGRHNCCLT